MKIPFTGSEIRISKVAFSWRPMSSVVTGRSSVNGQSRRLVSAGVERSLDHAVHQDVTDSDCRSRRWKADLVDLDAHLVRGRTHRIPFAGTLPCTGAMSAWKANVAEAPWRT
ncbi:MAG: hypothetical protein IPQ07_12900 [Myxococcales bacterium]|nr:hypothetical protein [Myxococcales bacterium]